MATQHGNQPSPSSTPPPPSSSSPGQSSSFRRKLGIGGHQSRHSHDKSFDSVRSSMTDHTTTSTSPLSPQSLSRSSTVQQRADSASASASSIPVLRPTIPAIDEDETFLTSTKQKIRLTASEETLLAALFCRVQDSHSANSVLRDPYAEPTLNRCEVDFSRSTFSVGQNSTTVFWASHRARTLDDWCVDFVNSCKGPVTIVHLGCGLDGRYLRVRDRFSKNLQDVHWVDIDRPMVVDLRDRIFRRPAPPEHYTLRTLDLSRQGWARDIPTGRPTLVIAEGLLMYLEPATVQSVIHEVVEYFGTGQIAFDKLGTLAVTLTSRVRFLKASRSAFTWAVDDPSEIEDIHPRLKLKDCVEKKSFMSGCIPIYGKLNPFVSLHPGDKYSGQFLRFEFSNLS